jgi:hypothetical protein
MKYLPSRNKATSFVESTPNIFNNKVFIMKYGVEDVYVDSIKTEGAKRSKTPSPDHDEGEHLDFVGDCVRVIT